MDNIPEPMNENELSKLRKISMERHGLGIYQYTLDGTIIYIDRITLRIFGLSESFPDPSMAIGKKLDDLINYTTAKGSLRKQLMVEGHFLGNRYHFKTLKGEDRWCIHDAYLMNHPQSHEEIVHIVIRDITESILKEKSHDVLQNQLYQAQKMEALGLLAGGIAHDFNNILQIIMGYGEMAQDNLEKDDPVMDSIEEIIQAGVRAKDLVSQLLSYSRRQFLSFESISVNSVVRDMQKMLRRLLGEHITLQYEEGEDLCPMMADPNHLGQIITNLCLNARDAMPRGGFITIYTGKAHFNESFCEANGWAKPGNYIMLSVRDNGCGMEEGLVERIFEPFFTTKDMGTGSGLGLSTVYGLVEQHKGFCHVESQLGEGSTFYIYLPATCS